MSNCERSLRNQELLPTMTALHVFQTILAPIGIFSLVRFARQLFRSSRLSVDGNGPNHISLLAKKTNRLVVHFNMEILYMNHLVAAVLFSFFSLITHVAFWGSLILSPNCDFRYPATVCIVMNTPMHIFTHAVALSLFFLCIERTFSTLFYRTYESVGSRVPKVMIAIQYAICSLIFYYQIYAMDFRAQMSICSLVNPTNQNRTTHVQITIFTLELASLIVFGALHNYNKSMLKRTIGMSLKERYQLDENVRCLRTILPTIIMHTLCFFVPNAIAIALYLLVNPAKAAFVVIDLACNWLPYYGLILPFVVNHLSKRANLVQVQRMAQNAATGATMQNSHFAELRQTWK